MFKLPDMTVNSDEAGAQDENQGNQGRSHSHQAYVLGIHTGSTK